jgi:hypothetical protein
MPMRLVSIYWFHFLVLKSTVCMWMDGWMDDDGWMTPIMARYNQLSPPTTVIDTPVVVWTQPR